jgi:hypothetical protein
MRQTMKIRSTSLLISFVSAALLASCATLTPKPSEIKYLAMEVAPGRSRDFLEITPAAIPAGVFTVPSGKVFVINSVKIYPLSPGSGVIDVTLRQKIGVTNSERASWVLPNSQPTQLEYSTGLVVSSGFTLIIQNHSRSSGRIRVDVHGYVASDE